MDVDFCIDWPDSKSIVVCAGKQNWLHKCAPSLFRVGDLTDLSLPCSPDPRPVDSLDVDKPLTGPFGLVVKLEFKRKRDLFCEEFPRVAVVTRRAEPCVVLGLVCLLGSRLEPLELLHPCLGAHDTPRAHGISKPLVLGTLSRSAVVRTRHQLANRQAEVAPAVTSKIRLH